MLSFQPSISPLAKIEVLSNLFSLFNHFFYRLSVLLFDFSLALKSRVFRGLSSAASRCLLITGLISISRSKVYRFFIRELR